MARCYACDSIRIGEDRGDGNCSVCHGDGHGTLFDRLAEGFGANASCYNCGGSGDCPNCGGTGEVDDD